MTSVADDPESKKLDVLMQKYREQEQEAASGALSSDEANTP